MASIGSFGTPRPALPADLTFGWFGRELRVNPDLSDVAVCDFMDLAASLEDDDPRALGVVKGFMRDTVHPDDFDEFWSLAKANRQDIADLLALFWSIAEAVAERPTERPAASGGGPGGTAPSSTPGSSSAVLELVSSSPVVTAALDATAGRPDLQLAVIAAQESQAAQTPPASATG